MSLQTQPAKNTAPKSQKNTVTRNRLLKKKKKEKETKQHCLPGSHGEVPNYIRTNTPKIKKVPLSARPGRRRRRCCFSSLYERTHMYTFFLFFLKGFTRPAGYFYPLLFVSLNFRVSFKSKTKHISPSRLLTLYERGVFLRPPSTRGSSREVKILISSRAFLFVFRRRRGFLKQKTNVARKNEVAKATRHLNESSRVKGRGERGTSSVVADDESL